MRCLDIMKINGNPPKTEKYLSLFLGQPLPHLVSFAVDASSNWRDEGEWRENLISALNRSCVFNRNISPGGQDSHGFIQAGKNH